MGGMGMPSTDTAALTQPLPRPPLNAALHSLQTLAQRRSGLLSHCWKSCSSPSPVGARAGGHSAGVPQRSGWTGQLRSHRLLLQSTQGSAEPLSRAFSDGGTMQSLRSPGLPSGPARQQHLPGRSGRSARRPGRAFWSAICWHGLRPGSPRPARLRQGRAAQLPTAVTPRGERAPHPAGAAPAAHGPGAAPGRAVLAPGRAWGGLILCTQRGEGKRFPGAA